MKIQVSVAVGLALLFAGCNSGSKKDSIAMVEIDWDNDGNIDQVSTLTYSRKTGQLTNQEWDYTDPAIDDILVTYEFDDNGFQSRQEQANAVDGTLIYALDQVNDERGNVLERRHDYNGDGTYNFIEYRSYSADNDVTREAYDFNGDGVIQRERLWTYASPGQFATRTFDDNGNGVFEYFETVGYEAGNVRENHFLIDRNGDGNYDEEYFASWTDNADGTITRVLERDLDMSGSIDRIDTRVMLTDDMREYFAKTLSVVRDFDNDGNPDKLEAQTFNARQQILTSSVDNNADGNPESVTEYDYDEMGNMTGYRLFNAQGDLYYRMSVTYEDWKIGQVELPTLSENT